MYSKYFQIINNTKLVSTVVLRTYSNINFMHLLKLHWKCTYSNCKKYVFKIVLKMYYFGTENVFCLYSKCNGIVP